LSCTATNGAVVASNWTVAGGTTGGTTLRRCRAAGLDLDGIGDTGTGVLRVLHVDPVSGLDQAEFDPLAAQGDDAVGADIEADGDTRDVNLHLPADGIDTADDPV
jgi:hypothetical protein